MHMADRFDLVIIGGGPAGYESAIKAAGEGFKTALIENRELGGTCLNRGCIPTKTILHSSELYAEMKGSALFGVHAENITCDMAGIQARKEEVLTQLRSGIAMLMKKNKIAVYQGTGTIINEHQVQVCESRSQTREADSNGNSTAQEMMQVLDTKYILIATGSVPALPPISGSDLPGVVTSDELLNKKELFPRLTIIGGGVIGMEFASIYSALGCKVTVIEFLDRILANMDKEISQNLKMILKKRGVDIHTGARVEAITQEEDGTLICHYVEKDADQTAESDGVLVAVGRRSHTEGLFGEGFALEMDRGKILVNEYGQTNVPSIYAAGDVTPGIQLAHAATAAGINAVAHMAYCEKGEGTYQAPLRTDLIPGCVYTNPEIGSIGLTQEEAKAQNIPVITKKYPMSANGKSLLSNQERGFIKVVADAESHRILGAQMMCARATDMISTFTGAIVNGLTVEEMAAVVYPHPTFAEGMGEVLRL